MVGIPDGLGAYDNGDGTMTVLMNHELGRPQACRASTVKPAPSSASSHRQGDSEVLQAEDLSKDVFFYDRNTDTYVENVHFSALRSSAGFARLIWRRFPPSLTRKPGSARPSGFSSTARKSAMRAGPLLTW